MDSEKTPLLKNVIINISTESCEKIENRNYIALSYEELEQYIHSTSWHIIRLIFAASYWLCFLITLIIACNIAIDRSASCRTNVNMINTTTTSDDLATVMATTAKTLLISTLGVTRTPPVI